MDFGSEQQAWKFRHRVAGTCTVPGDPHRWNSSGWGECRLSFEKIVNTLEQDEFYVRASRVEIPASITAVEFYRKFGYDYKNGKKELDEEHHYRLEKIVKAEKYEYNKVDHKNDIG